MERAEAQLRLQGGAIGLVRVGTAKNVIGNEADGRAGRAPLFWEREAASALRNHSSLGM